MTLAESLPWSWYSDPEVYRREQERIFRRTWQYACHTGLLPDPGSFVACRAGDVPVVVVRDEAGTLRAFLNVCRHRGSLLVEGEGRRRSLQCPYHAWTYGLDGGLRAAPRSEREPGFSADELSLVPVGVGTWGPFVFVNPDSDSTPLAEALGELPELVARAGVDVDALEFRLRAPFALEANWKVACENFLECYHCAVAHPGFSAVLDVAPDAYVLEETSDLLSTQYAPVRAGVASGGYDPSGPIVSGQFHFLWPNLKVNVAPGQPNLSLGPVLPAGPGRTEGFLDYFFAPDVDEGWIGELLAWDDQVGAEDAVLVARVQQGVSSDVLREGRLLAESERLIGHFDRLVLEALGG
ncbi:MAG: aromatic ring-hydroxylating dioxygenase subunit alpha [Actinobacteria bacterium]|nr:aromatic ring-hydroxylating dioxygenase subunit alpha [Actinomycetota bacterium]